jgi:hypothetical protein
LITYNAHKNSALLKIGLNNFVSWEQAESPDEASAAVRAPGAAAARLAAVASLGIVPAANGLET